MSKKEYIHSTSRDEKDYNEVADGMNIVIASNDKSFPDVPKASLPSGNLATTQMRSRSIKRPNRRQLISIPKNLLTSPTTYYDKQLRKYKYSSFNEYKEEKSISRQYFGSPSNPNPHFERCNLAIAEPKVKPKVDLYSNNHDIKKCLVRARTCDDSRGLVGLANLGNTCFMNSSLQCLLHCDYIVEYFTQHFDQNHICKDSPLKGSLAKSFARLCREIYHHDNHMAYVKPIQIKEVVAEWATQFDGYEQQDAHELLRFLLDGLDQDLKTQIDMKPDLLTEDQLQAMTAIEQGKYWWRRHISRNSSLVTDAFSGQFRSTITCLVCGREKYCFDPFYDLSLPIPNETIGTALKRKLQKNVRSADGYTLSDCLYNFVNDETLPSSDKTDCSWCKKQQEFKKSLKIERPPFILIIHLKRFHNSRRKKNTMVSFPLSGLNFSQFLSTHVNDNVNLESKSVMYDLFALCQHSGSINSGHYVA
jgi:ubiquitin C-terminal hydrolase